MAKTCDGIAQVIKNKEERGKKIAVVKYASDSYTSPLDLASVVRMLNPTSEFEFLIKVFEPAMGYARSYG